MPENLMNSAHKSNSDEYRKEYERIFNSDKSIDALFYRYPPKMTWGEIFKAQTQDTNNA